MDNAGAIQWMNSMGGSDNDFGQSVEQTNDGGFIVAGYTMSYDGDISVQHGNGDCWIIKCD